MRKNNYTSRQPGPDEQDRANGLQIVIKAGALIAPGNGPHKDPKTRTEPLSKMSKRGVPKSTLPGSRNALKPFEFIGFLHHEASRRGPKMGTETPPKTLPKTSQKGDPKGIQNEHQPGPSNTSNA